MNGHLYAATTSGLTWGSVHQPASGTVKILDEASAASHAGKLYVMYRRWGASRRPPWCLLGTVPSSDHWFRGLWTRCGRDLRDRIFQRGPAAVLYLVGAPDQAQGAATGRGEDKSA